MTLSLTINETLKWLSSLPILMQESYWWWQCCDRYILSFSLSPPPYPLPLLPVTNIVISLFWFLWKLSTLFTKGLPLGKRPIYCGHFSPDTMSCFFPAWQWEDFLNYNRGTDRYFSFFFFLDDIKVLETSEEVDSTRMLQMMRKDEAPYRLSGLIWTLLKTENHRKSNTTRCLPKNDSRG